MNMRILRHKIESAVDDELAAGAALAAKSDEDAGEPEDEGQVDESDISEDLADIDEELGAEAETQDDSGEDEAEAETETETEAKPAGEEAETGTEAKTEEEGEEPAPDASKEQQTASDEPKSLEEALARIRELEAKSAPAGERDTSAEAGEGSGESTSQPSESDGEALEAARAKAHESLTQAYALSQDDADKLLTEPEAVFPKLAANLHLSVLQTTMATVRENLADWIRTTSLQQELSQATEQAIYAANPHLKSAEAAHRDTVNRIARVYDNLNPKVPVEQRAREIGIQAMLALGITPEAQPATPGGKPPASSGKPRKPAASRGAGAPAGPGKGGEKNEFSEMAEEEVSETG